VCSADTTRRRYAAEDKQRSALLPALRSEPPGHSVVRRLGSLRDPALRNPLRCLLKTQLGRGADGSSVMLGGFWVAEFSHGLS
ncbi:hypothetical protein ACFV9P_31485, partial [Streptomyces sp. NPDC059892]|uniref:hypothetical protein n=1 Tax=Streptomyces sp. NPDC059892 TaxID=3346989 RepID=UPI003649411E